MTDPQDLARRYLALWEEYLTAALADAAGAPPLWGWAFGRPQPDEQGRDPGSAAAAHAPDTLWSSLTMRLTALMGLA